MKSIPVIRALFQHNQWAMRVILTTITPFSEENLLLETTFPQQTIWRTLLHIYVAEAHWLNLCRGIERKPAGLKWEHPNLPLFQSVWQAHETAVHAYLNQLDETHLATTITYPIPPDQTRTRPIWTVLLHMTTHTLQHRAEIAQMITDLGFSPGDLDFINFANEALT